MNDVEFENKLKSELQQRADRVTPSADAWARIQEQAATDHRRFGWMMGLGLVGAAGAAVAIGINVLDAPATVTIGPDPAGSEAVATTEGPTEVPATDGSRTATGDPSPSYDWAQSPLPATGAGVSAEGIASIGDTVMVIGDDPETRLPVAWLSTDGGRTFEQISPEGPSNGAWKDVIAFQGRFIVVGERLGQPAIDSYDPASGQWSPAYRDDDGNGVLYAITDGPSGPIATGEVRTGQGRHGLVLTVDSGDVWTSITGQPGFVSDETVLYHATATTAGYVATGYGPTSPTSTWFSPDGRTWEYLNPDGLGIRGQGGVVDVLVGDPTTGGFWAVEAGAAVSRSTDGRTWEVVSSLGETGELGFRTSSATVVGGDLLAFAGEGTDTAAYVVDGEDLRSAGLTRVEGNSLTVGAGATVLDDGTVMVPLSGPDGLFVWRGVPA